jgi:hypothetical protein
VSETTDYQNTTNGYATTKTGTRGISNIHLTNEKHSPKNKKHRMTQ